MIGPKTLMFGEMQTVVFVVKQLITSPTCMTSTSLLDHILTNSSERVSQSGIADVGLSDHQMTYCTRKITLSQA